MPEKNASKSIDSTSKPPHGRAAAATKPDVQKGGAASSRPGSAARGAIKTAMKTAAGNKNKLVLQDTGDIDITMKTSDNEGEMNQKDDGAPERPKPKLPKISEPVFPPKDRLLPLHEGEDDVPMCDADAHDKKTESEDAREVNGWSTSLQRHEGLLRKPELISQLLSRWWFVFPQWPPAGYDYKTALAKKGYREVPVSTWISAPSVDADGLAKVWQLGNFPGMFRNENDHKIIDMRPAKSCPCFLNLQRLPTSKLIVFLKRAYENQMLVLSQLEENKEENDKLKKEIAKELKELTAKTSKFEKDVTAFYNKKVNTHLRKLYD
ncbi:unnamed protein product [Amoebophrya sp. A120]|nr:unnamed protein product [Amoebophrya sp. A120]|eukprot:GSA120T00007205001.1